MFPRRRRGHSRVTIASQLLLLAIAMVAIGTALVRWVPSDTGAQAPRALPAPRFTEESAAAGLTFTYGGPFVYAVGGGVAVLDCDGDGRSDIYLAGGENPAALFRNQSPTGGALRFERLTGTGAELDRVNGAYPIDVDNDGLDDLITLRYGENVALRGLGDCRFERANERWRLDGGAERTEAFSATWEGAGRWPTLAFGNYADPESDDFETWCQPNQLLRPAGATDPEPTYNDPIALEPSFCALSMLFSSWDGSTRRDLRISNDRQYYVKDRGEEQLWSVEAGRAPALYAAGDGWNRVQIEGMGIASHDLTGDGLPEVYLTSQAASKLQKLDPNRDRPAGGDSPAYVDIGLPFNANVAHPFTGNDLELPSTAWHPEFADVNNDALVDLFVSKGNVTSQPDFALEDPSNLLLGQPSGPFIEGALEAGIVIFERGRGAALADFNLDGRLDLVESFYNAPARIWRNLPPPESEAANAHWLALRLEQPRANGDAIGAWLEVRIGTQLYQREVTVGGGHAGGQLGWLHVGLGRATQVEVRIRWPDGELGPWQPMAADRFGIIRRGAPAIEIWAPPA